MYEYELVIKIQTDKSEANWKKWKFLSEQLFREFYFGEIVILGEVYTWKQITEKINDLQIEMDPNKCMEIVIWQFIRAVIIGRKDERVHLLGMKEEIEPDQLFYISYNSLW